MTLELQPILEVEDLVVRFRARGASWRRPWLTALKGVSLAVGRGEIVGVVGESGSGKTTLGRAVVGLTPASSGVIRFDGLSLAGLSASALKPLRRRMQIIFQDPSGSLNPAMTVGETLGEALAIHNLGARRDRPGRVLALLDRVGLPRSTATRHPRELSGGQRQRVGVARALAVEPDFIVADEAVSALDVSVQAQIVNLLQDLQADLDLSLLFISHDLALVAHLCRRVVVLYLGKVVESAPAEALYSRPRHPYTRALLDAQPVLDPLRRRPALGLSGDPPSPWSPPSGCSFRTRCPYAEAGCAEREPSLVAVAPGHAVACVRHVELGF